MRNTEKARYIIIGMVIMTILSSTVIPVLAASGNRQLNAYFNNIKVYANGELLDLKDATGKPVEPFSVDGSIYLPVKGIAEAFKVSAEWDGATQSVYLGQRPGQVLYMPDVTPAYSSSEYREFSQNVEGGINSIYVAGSKYTNALAWSNRSSTKAFSVHNLNGQYAQITGKLSHVDSAGDSSGTLRIYFDGYLKREIDLTVDMYPIDLVLDVKGVMQIKFELEFRSYSDRITGSYALVDPVIR